MLINPKLPLCYSFQLLKVTSLHVFVSKGGEALVMLGGGFIALLVVLVSSV